MVESFPLAEQMTILADIASSDGMPSRAALEDLDLSDFPLGEARLFVTRLKAGDDPRDLLPLTSPAFRRWLFPGAPDNEEALAAQLAERWSLIGIEDLLQPPRRPE